MENSKLRYFSLYWNYLLGKMSYGQYLESEGVSYKSIIPSIDLQYINMYKDTNLIPLYIKEGKIVLGYLEDIEYIQRRPEQEELFRLSTYDYEDLYNKYYGRSKYFKDIPLAEYTKALIAFAIENKAMDISSYYDEDGIRVFLAVPPTKEHPTGKLYCPMKIPESRQTDFIRLMTGIDIASKNHDIPLYNIHPLDKTHEGRCVVQFAEPDKAVITIRIAENSVFNLTLEQLNLTKEVYSFLNHKFGDDRGGLRLIIGRPASGKNTTILSVLKNYIKQDRYKIIEIGRIERKLDGIIQLNCKSDEQLKATAESLIDVHPDIIYYDEISDTTGEFIINSCNIGVRVISTIHANSNADVFLRIHSMTGMPIDDIIQIMHSTVYQLLVPVNGRFEPRCRYIEYTDELKLRLYGRPLAEVMKILKEVEDGDNDLHQTIIAEE